jgi:hypothetical protein
LRSFGLTLASVLVTRRDVCAIGLVRGGMDDDFIGLGFPMLLQPLLELVHCQGL